MMGYIPIYQCVVELIHKLMIHLSNNFFLKLVKVLKQFNSQIMQLSKEKTFFD